MKPRADWTLYAVIDPHACRGRSAQEVARLAVQGGATVVQLRDKECSTREFLALAGSLHEMLTPLGVPLIINDRLDVALAVGAAGVHVGPSDMSPAVARRLMGEDALIGLSVETEQQALAAAEAGVDYLGVGPIFATSTKVDTASEWGLAGLRRLRSRSRHVLVAIGGVNRSNAAEVVRAGADGIAVVSAICAADEPEAAAAELDRIILAARAEGRRR